MDLGNSITIALVGKPNCGKSALFNALTGARQKVANYPGVTVERKEGTFKLSENQKVKLFDLPGIYSLEAESLDEQITHDVLMGKVKNTPQPDVSICIVDATNLQLSMRPALEVIQLGLPVIIVLNKIDIAENLGIKLDVAAFSEHLNVPVIPMSAIKSRGKDALIKAIKGKIADNEKPSKPVEDNAKKTSISKQIKTIREKIIIEKGRADNSTQILDSILLNRIFGPICFVILIFLIFQGVFNLASAPMDMIDGGISSLISYLNEILPDSSLKSLLTDGIIAGVGSVLIFLPQILVLFFFILLLEDTGYMARAAFLLDRLMGKVGLHGKAFIPLLSSFACAIPGIMATRTIENQRDRLVTILIAPLMTCSARLPVYTLIISAFIPNDPVFGPFRLQGMVMFSLYVAGILSAMLVAFILRKTFLKGERAPLLLEMPDYRMPHLRNLFLGLLERAKIFITRAGKIILPLMVIVWFLSSYPTPSGASDGPAILQSFAGMIGSFFAPLFAPLGFNWQMVVALIPGMAAREVAVGVLGTVYALSAEVEIESLGMILANQWSLPTALSFLTWYIFAPQCLPTLGITKRETNSWLWPSVMFFYLMVMAYLASFAVYNISITMGL